MHSTRRLRRALPSVLAVLLLLQAPGCSGTDPMVREEEEIRAAITRYLRERRAINPDAMRMEVVQLQLDGDRALAQVEFRSAEMQEGMRFEYQLGRVDGAWEVAGSSAREGHGGEARPLPDGHPPVAPDAAPAPPSGDS